MYIYIYIYMCIYVYICMYVYIYIHICICINLFTYIYTSIYIYTWLNVLFVITEQKTIMWLLYYLILLPFCKSSRKDHPSSKNDLFCCLFCKRKFERILFRGAYWSMPPHCLMIDFITWNSNSVPLFEGLSTSNPCGFVFSFLSFCWNRSDDLGTDSPALCPTGLVLHRLGWHWKVWGPI